MKFDNKTYIKLYKKYHLLNLKMRSSSIKESNRLRFLINTITNLKAKSFQDLKNIFDNFHCYVKVYVKKRRFIL